MHMHTHMHMQCTRTCTCNAHAHAHAHCSICTLHAHYALPLAMFQRQNNASEASEILQEAKKSTFRLFSYFCHFMQHYVVQSIGAVIIVHLLGPAQFVAVHQLL